MKILFIIFYLFLYFIILNKKLYILNIVLFLGLGPTPINNNFLFYLELIFKNLINNLIISYKLYFY